MKKLPQANFEFDDNFQVWKVLTSPSSTFLFVELRSAEELEAVFVCIDLAKNEIIWDDLSFENSWAFSLCEVDNQNIYLTEFEDGEVPEAKAVMAVSIQNKEILWYKEEVIFETIINNNIVLTDKKNNQYEKIVVDALLGEKTEKKIPDYKALPINSSVKLPYSYEEGSSYFETVSNFLSRNQKISIVKCCDYIEINSYIIIGFYTLNEENKLNNYISLLDNAGNLLFKELIGENLGGIGSETFFIANKYLIYIKHKKEIVTFYLKD